MSTHAKQPLSSQPDMLSESHELLIVMEPIRWRTALGDSKEILQLYQRIWSEYNQLETGFYTKVLPSISKSLGKVTDKLQQWQIQREVHPAHTPSPHANWKTVSFCEKIELFCKMLSSSGSNGCVLGIMGKLIENVREWWLFRAISWKLIELFRFQIGKFIYCCQIFSGLFFVLAYTLFISMNDELVHRPQIQQKWIELWSKWLMTSRYLSDKRWSGMATSRSCDEVKYLWFSLEMKPSSSCLHVWECTWWFF